MNRFAALGAALVLILGATMVVAAASPAPSTSPTSKPSATTAPSATSKPTASPSASPSATPATAGQVFNATVNPLQISGSATVRQLSGGGATVTLTVSGLLDDQPWFVDIDGGTVARPNEGMEIAWKAGSDVMRVDSDTIRVHLTKAEMARFLKAQSTIGVVATVSDGTRVGYAEFHAGS